MFETAIRTSPFDFARLRHSIGWSKYIQHKLFALAGISAVLFLLHALFDLHFGDTITTVEHASLFTDIAYAVTKKEV